MEVVYKNKKSPYCSIETLLVPKYYKGAFSMCKQSIGHKKLISQCLSLLPDEVYSDPLLNYGNDKLSIDALMKIFVAAQLGKWNNYKDIEEKIGAFKEIREATNLESISGSHLSRRVNSLPTEFAQDLFFKTTTILQDLTMDCKGLRPEIGKLKIVDSTVLKLPPQLCDWGYVSKELTAVKMHTRLAVVTEGIVFPDKIIPSTGNVSDFESAQDLIEETDATYLMDRGYPSKKNLYDWLEKNILFLVRITKSLRVFSVEEYQVDHPRILRDAKVLFGTSDEPVRLVEFEDEEKRIYRLMTTRWDLSAEEIMDLYRSRWMIETFFRSIKQHLNYTKIWSQTPQGVWNQMFLALTAYNLTVILQLLTKTEKTFWQFLQSMRTYMHKTWKQFEKEVRPKRKKASKGRQKVPIQKKKEAIFPDNVGIYKPKKIKKSSKKKRMFR